MIRLTFKKIFYTYLIFVCLLYGLFFDIYSWGVLKELWPYFKWFTLFREVFFLIVLIVFIFHFLLRPNKLHVPKVAISIFSIFFIYMISSLFRSYESIGLIGSALTFRNMFGYVPILFMSTYIIQRKEDIYKIIDCLVYITMGISIYAILQFFFKYESPFLILSGAGWKLESGYINSTFISYIELSLFCNLAIMLFLSVKNYYPNKMLLWFVIILTVLTIVVIQSRTGIIVLGCSVVIALIKYKLIRFRFVFGLFLLIILSVYRSSFFIEKGQHRLLQQNLTEDVRFVSVWSELIPILFSNMSNMILGHGMGRYGPAATKAAEISDLTLDTSYVDSSFFSLLLNGGVVGFVFFLIFLLTIYMYVERIVKKSKDFFLKDILKGILLGIIVILIYSIPFNAFDSFPGNIYLWFLLGMSISIRRIINLKPGAPENRQGVVDERAIR